MLVWMTGFEHNLSNTDYTNMGWTSTILGGFDPSSTNQVVSDPYGNDGGNYSLELTPDAFLGQLDTFDLSTTGVGTTTDQVWLSFFYHTTSFLSTNQSIIAGLDVSDNVIFRLEIIGATIAITDGSSTIATAALPLGRSNWHHIALGFDMSNTGSLYQYALFVDGTEVIASATVASSTQKFLRKIRFYGGENNVSIYFDNFCIFDDFSTDQSTATKPIYIKGIKPDADITDGSFVRSDNSNNVDLFTVVSDDNLSTYIDSSGVASTGVFGLPNISSGISSVDILGLQYSVVTGEDLVAADTTLGLNISGSDYDQSAVTVAAQYSNLSYVYETNPDTAAAWTTSDVDGLNVRFTVSP